MVYLIRGLGKGEKMVEIDGNNIKDNAKQKSKLRDTLSAIRNSGIFENKKSFAGLIILLFYVFLALLGPFFVPYSPTDSNFALNQAPSAIHILGTNEYGEDIFSRLLYGGAPTLEVGLAVGVVATLISVLVGISAGLSGGYIDKILDGFTYIFIIIPGIMFIILIGSLFIGAGIYLGYYSIFLVLTLTGWAWGARVLRSQTKSIATKNFIISSKLVGESRISILFRQIIKNMFPLIISNFFFAAMYGVLGLTWIEFFGLGNVDSINWGTMLYWAIGNEAYLSGEWWWYIPVSLLIAGLAMGFALLNSGFDEISNPSLRIYKK